MAPVKLFDKGLLMGSFFNLRKIFAGICFSGCMLAANVQATIVKFETNMGDIEINLFDKTTPETVENFLYYVNQGAYHYGVIHRSAKTTEKGVTRNFIIQGGRYTYDGALKNVITKMPVINEPVYSNLRGTIAMAKVDKEVHSATSGWFFNLEDNPKLDRTNGGFTVFGQVTPESLPVLDAIASVKTFYVDGMLSPSNSAEFPLRDYTVEDYQNNHPIDENNLVLITAVTIIDSNPDTANSLTPVKNPNYKDRGSSSGSGSGSLSIWFLLVLLIVVFANRFPFRRYM
jgi:peptidyl-prolyl cis-trans isomerase A (cyclophilin A)